MHLATDLHVARTGLSTVSLQGLHAHCPAAPWPLWTHTFGICTEFLCLSVRLGRAGAQPRSLHPQHCETPTALPYPLALGFLLVIWGCHHCHQPHKRATKTKVGNTLTGRRKTHIVVST